MNNSFESPVHICPHCQERYTLGVDGTIDGCDQCMNVIRNKLDGSIIEAFPFFEDAELLDTMTDMEKA